MTKSVVSASIALVAALVLCLAPAAADTFGQTLHDARLAIDTGNVAASVELYEKALAMRTASAQRLAPERSWAYVRLGIEALIEHDYGKADACYTLAAAIHPPFREHFLGHWIFARLQETSGEISEAMENPAEADWPSITAKLKWTLEIEPENRQANHLMGLVSHANGQSQEARARYIKTLKGRKIGAKESLESLGRRAGKLISATARTFDLRPVYPPWLETEFDKLQAYERDGLIIYHRNQNLAERVDAVVAHLLAQPALDGLIEAHGPFPPRCKIYIFADEKEFHEEGGSEKWAAGQAKITARGNKLETSQIHLFQTAGELTESALPHEITHVRLIAASPIIEGVPLWLQEGVAVSQESQYKRKVMARTIVQARSNLIPLDRLIAAQEYPAGEDKQLFYAQSVALVESLVELHGPEAIWKFISLNRKSNPGKALEKVYSLSGPAARRLMIDWGESRQ